MVSNFTLAFVKKKADLYLEVAGFLILCILWIFYFSVYKTLPEIIPIHFNGKGKPDALGSRNELLDLPKIASILYFLITVLSLLPGILYHIKPIENVAKMSEYSKVTTGLRVLKIAILVIFLIIFFLWYLSI